MNKPTEVGLYLGKSDGSGWWNLVIEVRGEAPFFDLSVWDRNPLHDSLHIHTHYDASAVKVWGPKIEEP